MSWRRCVCSSYLNFQWWLQWARQKLGWSLNSGNAHTHNTFLKRKQIPLLPHSSLSLSLCSWTCFWNSNTFLDIAVLFSYWWQEFPCALFYVSILWKCVCGNVCTSFNIDWRESFLLITTQMHSCHSVNHSLTIITVHTLHSRSWANENTCIFIQNISNFLWRSNNSSCLHLKVINNQTRN